MSDDRMYKLRVAILDVLSSQPLSISELQEKLRERKVEFGPGEIQEVLWRLTAAKELRIEALGTVRKDRLVASGGRQ